MPQSLFWLFRQVSHPMIWVFVLFLALTLSISEYLIQQQQQRVQQSAVISAKGVSSLLVDHLAKYRLVSQSIANHHQDRILELGQGGGYPFDLMEVSEEIFSLFEDAAQFAIINQDGKAIVGSEGFDLGGQCQYQLEQLLVGAHSPKVFQLHGSDVSRYHYDVIIKLERGDEVAGLLVSFTLETFQRLFNDFNTSEVELFLVNSLNPSVIIASSLGIGRSYYGEVLDNSIIANTLTLVQVTGTEWSVVALPTPQLFEHYAAKVRWTGFILAGLLFVVILLFMLFIAKVKAARKKLEEATAHDAMFNAGPTILFQKQVGYKMLISYVSPNVESMIGCKAQDLMAQSSFLDLVMPEDRGNLRGKIEQAIADKQHEVELEYRLIHQPDGSYRWVYDLTHILYDAKGNASGLQGYVTSIHGQKLAEQRANDLIENSPNAMVVSNESGEIVRVNQALMNLFGYDRAELLGSSIDMLLPMAKRDAHARYRQQYLSMPDVSAYQMGAGRDLYALSKSGQKIPVAVNLSRMSVQDGVLILSVIRDISVQKEAQMQMLAAKNSAEALAKARSRFLAMMSHEIRTPMNGVLGMADLLCDTPLDDTQKSYLDAINQSGHALLDIINEILDFSKLDEGLMRLEERPFDLFEVIDASVQLLEGQAKAHKVNIVYDYASDCPRAFIGDAGRIRQVIVNLLGNAIKFTQEGEVTLTVQLMDYNAERVNVEITVADNGIGISAEHINRLFSAFSQADDSTTREYGGTGLGLAITKQLVELMGGTIGVSSVLKQGSTFWVRLPLLFQPQPLGVDVVGRDVKKLPAVIDNNRAKPLQNRRVLLAEDNAINLQLAYVLLEKLGCTIDIAHNGLEALQFWRTHSNQYCLILMDCQMPLMDGYEAMLLIRQEEARSGATHPIPVVALTANAMMEDRERCMAMGMSDFLSKPIERTLFNSTVLKWCLSHETAERLGEEKTDNAQR